MISAVRDYVRSRMSTFNLNEWTDGFIWANIPKSVLDSTFHFDLGLPRAKKYSQDVGEIDVPLTLRVFISPQGDTRDLVIQAEKRGELIWTDLVQIINRTNWPGVKNFLVDTMSIDPLGDSNNNGLVIKLECTALVVIGCR